MRTLKLAILLALICTISSLARADIYMECSLPHIRGELKIVEGWWSDKVYIEKEGQVGWEKLDAIVNDDNIIINSHNDYQINDVKFSDRFGDNVSSGYCSRKCDMKYSISLMPKNDKDTYIKNLVEVKEFNANDCDVPAQVWRFVEYTNEELKYKSNKCNETIKEWNSINGNKKINRKQFLNEFRGKNESIILDELYKRIKRKQIFQMLKLKVLSSFLINFQRLLQKIVSVMNSCVKLVVEGILKTDTYVNNLQKTLYLRNVLVTISIVEYYI